MFWHVFAKIPRHTRQNAITEGDLECILTRNCEDTEQLRWNNKKTAAVTDTRYPKNNGYLVLACGEKLPGHSCDAVTENG